MKMMAGSKKQQANVRKRKKGGKHQTNLSPDIQLKLFELLQGERASLVIFSKKLKSRICLVNPALKNPGDMSSKYPVYTTNELAFILSFGTEELKRFHYLKTRLVD